MSKNSFSERVPIFGEVNITLNRESKVVFEKFKKDIDRLGEINQLGILHDFLKIPQYTRYDYVLILNYLIEKAANSDSGFKSKVKILDSSFSSLEELLKSWALIYSLGHFQMTFAAEHAFLRSVIDEDKNFKLIMADIEELFDNSEFFDDDEKSMLKEDLVSIFEKEKMMSVYKIFTILKIENIIKNFHEKDQTRLKELTKLMIFKENYLDYLSSNHEKFKLDRKIKLEKVIKYFEVIRRLTFTILDGSISQTYININHMPILENLNTFIEDKDYKTLLRDINRFYTSELYNSPESAYYHHRCVFQIQQDVFKDQIRFKDLSNHETWKELDEKINVAVSKVKNDISKNNNLIDESGGEYKNYIQEELRDHIRIKIPNIDKPVTYECKTFGLNQPNRLFGGLLNNQSDNSIEIDYYPNSKLSDRKRIIYTLLNSLNSLYTELMDKENQEISFFKNLALIKTFLPENLAQSELEMLPQVSETVIKDKLTNFLAIFNDISQFLLNIIFLPEMNFSSWSMDKVNIHFPIFSVVLN
jgi:hypothetical protein